MFRAWQLSGTESVRGTWSSALVLITATDVDDGSAVCTAISGSGFQAGDRVRTVVQ
jgi:hypothetical protein